MLFNHFSIRQPQHLESILFINRTICHQPPGGFDPTIHLFQLARPQLVSSLPVAAHKNGQIYEIWQESSATQATALKQRDSKLLLAAFWHSRKEPTAVSRMSQGIYLCKTSLVEYLNGT